uniref:Uncharacterized protein n=1 Tax=Panagrolaimus superbus TaxID=310955 RepID=A0A914YAY2_9BILA
MSPPSQKQSLYNRVSPRQIPPTRRVSPPTPVHTPPQQHYRVSPRPQPQVPSQFSSSNSFRKIDFDDSAQHEDDDDHMEFSKYIPNKKPKRTKNVAFQINPTFITGIAFTICVFAYLLYPDKIHSGINTSSNYLNSAIMAGFKYAIMPFLVLGVIFAVGCAIYYGFQAHSKSKAIYEEKKKKMIKEILKAVYNAPANGIAVKQLRDKMIPAYDRTKDELNLWNVCEDFVKTYETRVRAEERTNAKGDEEVEHFVWVASTLNQDLEDD